MQLFVSVREMNRSNMFFFKAFKEFYLVSIVIFVVQNVGAEDKDKILLFKYRTYLHLTKQRGY